MKLRIAAACWFVSIGIGVAQVTHYLDCGRPSGGDSLRPETAWVSVEQANAVEFQPGDKLLLRRGSRCEGTLAPKGSGTQYAQILIGAYGEGPLPLIDGEKRRSGLELNDQQYWDIENLEILGGDLYGVHIGADRVSIRHLQLRNLVIHRVSGEPKSKESGLLVVAPANDSTATINDVLVDGVTAYDTTQWAGIIIAGASYNEQKHRYGDEITIRNSIVHDVAGDGILLASARHGLIEHNVTWNTGMQETETIGTPNAIWEWMCLECRVAWNEGFFSDSPGVDGGVFDIDYGNVNNVVEHNFAHDSQGYCAAIFGAEGQAGDSIHSIVNENTCLHNGRSPRLARRQGAIFINTWHRGRLNGIEVTRNTILWEPPLDAPAIHAQAEFFGDLPNRIHENRILLAAGSAVESSPSIEVDGNHVCVQRQRFAKEADSPTDFCTCWSTWRNEMTKEEEGAFQLDAKLASVGRGWRLATTVASDGAHEEGHDNDRARVVLLESMMQQFGRLGIGGVLWPRTALSPDEIAQLRADWHLSSRMEIASFGTRDARLSAESAVFLLSPDNEIVARWQAPVDTAHVWLELEQRLGTPAGMQPASSCSSKQ